MILENDKSITMTNNKSHARGIIKVMGTNPKNLRVNHTMMKEE